MFRIRFVMVALVSAFAAFSTLFALRGGAPPPCPALGGASSVAELARLQSAVDAAIKRLAAETWSERDAAERELTDVLVAHPVVLDYLLSIMRSTRDPEIGFRLKNVFRGYYLKKVNPVAGRRGFIGLRLAPIAFGDPAVSMTSAILIVGVEPGLPGEKAGLRNGDMILETDGVKMSVDEFIEYIAMKGPGRVVTLTIRRGAEAVEKKVTLVERPKELPDPLDGATSDDFFKKWLDGLLGKRGGWK